MQTNSKRFTRRSLRLRRCRRLLLFLSVASFFTPFFASCVAEAQEAQQSREAGGQLRLPRQQAQTNAALDGVIRSGPSSAQVPVAGATVELRNLSSNSTREYSTNGEGVLRIFPLVPGDYSLLVHAQGYSSFSLEKITLHANEVLTLEISLLAQASAEVRSRLPRLPELGGPLPAESVTSSGSYREFRHRLDSDPNYVLNPAPESLPPVADVFATVPDRWALQQPEYRRYSSPGEYVYTRSRWYDPFNRNRLKGDEPIWPAVLGQQVFLNLTATSDTTFDGRRVPSPSGVSAENPGSATFFGHGEQEFVDQTLRFTFDLFRGDASFKPVDWRIRITPEISLNDLNVRELGIVGPDVRSGTNRLDSHFGLQEAFAEVKLHDLSSNYDFISIRAGIQGFNSDFRGFIFVDEQPGIRLFGNLKSNLYQYNLAYFNFLEKNTNSGLNSLALRNQQVIIANVYRQDFFFKGYTAQFSFHYNKDDATIHFDDNGFLVRPAPIGGVVSNNMVRPHSIRAAYLGWTGDGHIGPVNLTHAFYQALGDDSFNGIAGRRVTINAQMAALELSVDKDWARFKGSVFYASGSANPRGGRARGFDAIEDFPEFAGGIFSLWNREGIRLTGAGVTLTPPNSLLPSLRSNKDEGQANFVNPGIFLANAGANFDLTPKLRSFVNVDYMRFERTEPLELLLFQAPIRHTIGVDSSIGVRYRPPLTENISITAGAAALVPGQGFRDIYGSRTMFSLFTDLRFQF